jgi:HNH endonuclease
MSSGTSQCLACGAIYDDATACNCPTPASAEPAAPYTMDELRAMGCPDSLLMQYAIGWTREQQDRLIKPAPATGRLEEILAKTITQGECMIWQGTKSIRPEGQKHKPVYPMINHNGKAWRGNRLVLTLTRGPIPEGLLALHTCDNSLCLNPKHLYAGTAKQNVADAYNRKRAFAAKQTHCKHGHPLSGENLKYDREGWRVCRTCKWYTNRDMQPQKELKFGIK